jgi:hypothetical protein
MPDATTAPPVFFVKLPAARGAGALYAVTPLPADPGTPPRFRFLKDDGTTYQVSPATCDCPDHVYRAKDDADHVCKHRAALAELAKSLKPYAPEPPSMTVWYKAYVKEITPALGIGYSLDHPCLIRKAASGIFHVFAGSGMTARTLTEADARKAVASIRTGGVPVPAENQDKINAAWDLAQGLESV